MLTRRVFLKGGGMALLAFGAGPTFSIVPRSPRRPSSPGRRKVLVTIFQRGAMGWPDGGVTGERSVARGLSASARHVGGGRERTRIGHARSGCWIRPASGILRSRAALEGPPPGDRARGRLARPDAFALRRAGLHGDRNAGPQGHALGVAQPGRGPAGPRCDAVSRRRDDAGAAALALRRYLGAGGHQSRRLQSAPARRGQRREERRRRLRVDVRADLAVAAAEQWGRGLRCHSHALRCSPRNVPARSRGELSVVTARTVAAADRTAHQVGRRPRSRVRRVRRVGHARAAGHLERNVRTPRARSRSDHQRSGPTSAPRRSTSCS